ncbi:hypothetical protein GOBAR_AA14825 [Gossypium barbadense]|uniref:Uncharacterized protein n=1 Tax=Gossypium barbadense TaxID=3634 RepID=A0A2P5XRB2_GOSBA|nr:hypothetical protein GOBAR_AA14825 [Gossypium barbadense]
MVHDTFPFWLEKLPSLKVLILRANRFYGTITKFDTERGFPKLRILDTASNNFSGDLSIAFLQSLKAMMQITNDDKAKLVYIGEQYYQDSVTIVNKGIEMLYQKVLTILTCLDLSNNSYASGLVVGLCIGYTVLNELGNKWVNKFKKGGKRNRTRCRRYLKQDMESRQRQSYLDELHRYLIHNMEWTDMRYMKNLGNDPNKINALASWHECITVNSFCIQVIVDFVVDNSVQVNDLYPPKLQVIACKWWHLK